MQIFVRIVIFLCISMKLDMVIEHNFGRSFGSVATSDAIFGDLVTVLGKIKWLAISFLLLFYLLRRVKMPPSNLKPI